MRVVIENYNKLSDLNRILLSQINLDKYSVLLCAKLLVASAYEEKKYRADIAGCIKNATGYEKRCDPSRNARDCCDGKTCTAESNWYCV
uniref:Uncharacterized protein n=1 Tax=Meloidogyne hapla TaxID=6305 RepID=A0A1I8BE05_MELHA